MARIFKLRGSTVHERFGDETVILNLDSGSYFSVQGVGSTIWGFVAAGASDTAIANRIAADYAGDNEEISKATMSFLDELVAEQLVEAEDGAGAPAEGNGHAPNLPFTLPVLHKYTDMEEMLLLDPIHEVDEHGWPTTRQQPD